MNNSLKRKIYKMNLLLVCSSILFTSCKPQENKKENVLSKKIEFKAKETKFAKDNTTDVLIDDNNIKKDDIERVIKHGDHWHVFTKDGKEHITYSDPDKIGDDDFSLVSVVSTNILKSLDVVKILKHGDHYHVYTSSGMEYLTYENPASAFPNIPIGTYVGTHASNARKGMNSNMVAITDKNGNPIASVPTTKSVLQDDVVKILRHGDHWHIYTRSGNEFISYKDPSKKYPNIPIGTYVGTHESNANNKVMQDIKNDIETGNTNSTEHKEKVKSAIDNLNITSVLGQEAVNRNDIVKILRHEDHWHIYDSQGREGIVYEDPSALYPNAIVGEYVGSHGDSHNDNEPSTGKEITWPKNITRILDHGNHWHLYSGNKEVAVVYQDPKPHYKEQIDSGEIEYIDEHRNKGIEVKDEELFTYESVVANKNLDILKKLDDNLRSMTHYGDITKLHTGADGNEGFYWHHIDHYHGITIKEIIQNQKAGAYGNYTAKEVVAALKWMIKNPVEAANINEEIKKENGSKEHQVEEFLKKHYPKASYIESGNGNVYIDGIDKPLKLADFTVENGKVKYNGNLPEVKDDNSKEQNQPSEADLKKKAADDKKSENEEKLYVEICAGMGGRITSLQSEISKKKINLAEAEVDVASKTITVKSKGTSIVYEISFADDDTATLTKQTEQTNKKEETKQTKQK